jgi:hypothetical protein
MGGINPFAYVRNKPMTLVDPSGLDYSIVRHWDTLEVTASITIYGPLATAELAQKWQQGINDYWNNFGNYWKYSRCTVKFNITVQADPSSNWWFTAKTADNYVYVMSPTSTVLGANIRNRSYVYLSKFGNWRSNADGRVGAHEVGHFFGLPDDYDDVNGPKPGHSGELMADSINGVVNQYVINQLLRKSGCTCR